MHLMVTDSGSDLFDGALVTRETPTFTALGTPHQGQDEPNIALIKGWKTHGRRSWSVFSFPLGGP